MPVDPSTMIPAASGLWCAVSGRLETSRETVLLHGFTQTHRCWDRIAGVVGRTGGVLAVDLPGHGNSSMVRADLVSSAELLAAALGGGADGTRRGRRRRIVGYSMGGRVALHLALARPDLVDELVLVGATAGLRSDAERAQRRETDETLATRVEALGVAAFLDEWLAGPLFASLPDDPVDRRHRLANTAEGLASSLRLCGTGTQEPLWERLGALRCPTTLVVGDLDTKFTAIAHELAAALPPGVGRVVVVPGAGHACHLESPDVFLGCVFGV